MAYRLPGGRFTLDLEPHIEVELLPVGPLRQSVLGRLSDALTGADRDGAILDLYRQFLDEAQPTWDLLDHRGVIPASMAGMLRLPVDFGMSIVMAWLEGPPSSVVDKKMEPGPFAEAVKAELKRKRTNDE